MLHNKASESLVKRIRSLVQNHRVVSAGDGEAPTTISVPGLVVDAMLRKKTFALQKVEFQFLENHKTLYLDLHREFTKSEYAPQSEASVQNFKTLLMLEITILLGTDFEWATGSTCLAAVADPPVLAPQAVAAADDGDASISEDSDAPGRAIRDAAATALAPAIANADDNTDDAGSGAGATAAPAAEEDADRNTGRVMQWS
jgi:hypothetical protein